MRPIHPGEVLREEFTGPLGLSARALAAAIHVPANRVAALLNEQRGVTGDTALRLARYFRTTPEFWMNLQSAFDLRTAKAKASQAVESIQPYAN